MNLITFSSPSAYRQAVLPFLLNREAQTCLGLGVLDTLIHRPEVFAKAYLWAITDGDKTVGAAWMTPPHPLGLSDMPEEALELLLEAAMQLKDPPTAVVGPKAQSDYFAKQWVKRQQQSIKRTMAQRIYQLTAVTMPTMPRGHMRLADAGDEALLEEWNGGFIRACRLNESIDTAKDYALRAIADKSRFLWIVDGKPVAMTGASGTTPSGIRINWVFTPQAFRGQGYASALVATLSKKLLDEGRKFCFLYTDLANPTSNSIYQKIGYQPVCDSAHHIFAPLPSS